MKVAETPAGNQQRETVHGPPFYVAGTAPLKQHVTICLMLKKKLQVIYNFANT